MLQSHYLSPERRLYRAVIEDALFCIARWVALKSGQLELNPARKTRSGRTVTKDIVEEGRAALRYLKSRMFETHCAYAGFSAGFMRRKIKKITKLAAAGALNYYIGPQKNGHAFTQPEWTHY